MKPESAPSRRRSRAVESYSTAAECLGKIEPGLALFAITRGQFSMIDAILACLAQTGPAALSLWTWCIADYEVECVERLIADGGITSARLVIDVASRGKNRPLLLRWLARFGPDSIRLCRTHAKLATIQSADYRLLLRGSMNLNHNPRLEQLDITEGGEDFALVRRVEEELEVLALNCTAIEARNATGVLRAWSPDQLVPFEGVRTWTP